MIAYQIQAFTKENRGGNPAGVVLGQPTVEAMQSLAHELGFSETVFIKEGLPIELRYFTPSTELDMCGHATLAAFAFLLEQGKADKGETIFKNNLGLFKIAVREDNSVYLRQAAPSFYGKVDKAKVAPILHLTPDAILGEAEIVSTGLKDLFIEVSSLEALQGIVLDEAACTALSVEQDVTSFHVYACDSQGQLHARNFGPAVGIPEESATGSSSGALAALLYQAGRVQKRVPFTILQGEAMQKTSLILVELGEDGVPWVGGYCSPSVRVR